MPTLSESRNRILYSGVREAVSDGLGHGMCTANADIATALRLGLTYTHRVAKYGSLVSQQLADELRGESPGRGPIAGLSEEVGKVEAFFAWGVGEVPREAVQEVACPVSGDLRSDLGRCKLCLGGKGGAGAGGLVVERVVEIPMQLSYYWPRTPTSELNRSLERFLKQNAGPNVVFHMPRKLCDRSPAYSRFDRRSRTWFFHKYWDAHRRFGVEGRMRIGGTVRLYREGWGKSLKIPGVPKRDRLQRLKEFEVTVAVHARRGDFFMVGRPMVRTRDFVKVVRRVMKVVVERNDTFSRMPVAVIVYSEGKPKEGLGEAVGHDVARLTRDYHDADGRVMNSSEVGFMLRENGDGLGNVFPNGVRVELRVSQDTLLCLHEMVAADVFVGSMSGMSLHLVGSLSRGAMMVLPARVEEASEWYGHVKFEYGGLIGEGELELMKAYWEVYAKANEASARRAFEQYVETKRI